MLQKNRGGTQEYTPASQSFDTANSSLKTALTADLIEMAQKNEFIINGKKCTLDDIRKMLDDPKLDLNEKVNVADMEMSYADLKKVVSIEDDIAETTKQYTSPEDLDEEQRAAYDSIMAQLNSEGIELEDDMANARTDLSYGRAAMFNKSVGSNEAVELAADTEQIKELAQTKASRVAIDHTARISTQAVFVNKGATSAQLTFTLSKALPYAVSFDWRTADASAVAGKDYTAASGTLSFNPGETTKTVDISLLNSGMVWKGYRSFEILCSNANNVLFNNGYASCQAAVNISSNDSLPNLNSLNVNDVIKYSDFRIENNWAVDPEVEPTQKIYKWNNNVVELSKNEMKKAYWDNNPGRNQLWFFALEYSISVENINGMNNARALNLADLTAAVNFKNSKNSGSDIVVNLIANYGGGRSEYHDYQYNEFKQLFSTALNKETTDIQILLFERKDEPKKALDFFPVKIENKPNLNVNSNKPNISVTAASGTYYPGQLIPIVLHSDIGLDGATARIKVNGKELMPEDVDGMDVKFYYPVTTADSDINVESVYGAKTLNGVQMDTKSVGKLNGIKISKNPTEAFKSMSVDKADYSPQGDTARVEIELDTNASQWLEQNNGLDRVKLALPGSDEMSSVAWKLNSDGSKATDTLVGEVKLPSNYMTAAQNYTIELILDGAAVVGKTASAKVRGATFPQTITIDSNKYPADNIIYFTKGLKLDFTTNPIFSSLEPTQEASWLSSDNNVATIDNNGNVSCISEGKVKFTVSLQGANGPVIATTPEFSTVAGGTPEINFSGDISTNVYTDTTVAWNTNIVYKNTQKGKTTDFAVKLYKGADTSVAPVWETTVTDVSSVKIPADKLSEISNGDQRAYTVEVVCANPDVDGEAIAAKTGIVTEALPVVVRFDKLDNYFITDTTDKQAVHISLQNVDETNGAEYKYSVKKNGKEIISKSGKTTEADINFEIVLDDVDEKDLRDIYIVSAEAHNSDDPVSADSFILYVYQDGTMDILVDGENKDEKLLSNRKNPEFTKTRTDKIDWLRENANLKANLSIDRGDFKWCNVDDQIKWESSENDVASINYNDRGWYSDIEDFEFTSYRPSTEFMMVGKGNGSTTISATHAKTGMSTSINVDVETLKDKLYVFNFYPKQKTTVKYTNGDGKEVTLETNDQGEIAIYEENGIASDISLSSGTDEDLYLGTLYKENLISSEADPSQMELYPANIFSLRSAAKVKVNILKEDGTPYVGELSISGGVYKNGKYCPATEIKDLSYTTDNAGEFKYTMDTTKFWTDSNTEDLNPSDSLEYVFIARTPNDKYFPLHISLDGDISEKNKASFGENAVLITEVTDDRRNKPFIASQKAKVTGRNVGWSSVMYYDSNIGISDAAPQLDVKTTVLWWGMDDADTGEVYTTDEYNKRLSNQKTSDVKRYPFSDIAVSENIVTYDADNLADRKEGKTLKPTTIINDSKGKLLRSQSAKFNIANMLGIEMPDKSSNVIEEFKNVTPTAMSADVNDPNFKQGGEMVEPGTMDILSKLNIESQYLTIGLYPTLDPMEWQFIATAGISKMADGEDHNILANQSSDNFGFLPGPLDLYKMVKGTYGEDNIGELVDALRTGTGKEAIYGAKAGGFYEGIVRYDPAKKKWSMKVRSGGYTIGAAGGYQWSVNTLVGPVPVTASASIAAGLEFDHKILVTAKPNQPDESFNNMLMNLRVNAYVKAFVGLGFDITVLAIRFGVFGEVNLDNNNSFLKYMNDEGKVENISGQHTKLGGRVGIEFYLKILFIKYRKILASKDFTIGTWETGQWDKIEAWRQAANFPSDFGGYKPEELAMLMALSSMETVKEGMYAEDRGYLDLAERVWGSDDEVSLMSLDEPTTTENLQSNAYPYANPYTTEDGKLMVFLSDGDSKDLNATQVQYSIKSGESYGAPQAVPGSGEGLADSNLQLAGTSNFAVAAWQRQTKQLTLEEGQEANEDDLNAMMSATDVCVSVYKGGKWQTEQLTKNSIPDMAPVVATNGDKAIAVWRRVASTSTDSLSATNFDAKDELVYKTYEGGQWSEEKILYNGTMGAVKGLNVAMDAYGNAVVTYTADTKNYIGKTVATADDMAAGSEKFEIVYSHIASDGTVSSPVKLTNDENPDENPQITTAKIDGAERFVTAWYTQRPLSDEVSAQADNAAAQNKVSDIQMRVINADGSIYSNFVDSIREVQNSKSVAIGNQFRFAKGAKALNNLALVWTAPAMEIKGEEKADSYDCDELFAVRFCQDGEGEPVSLTSALPVVAAEENTKIDHFDAYVTNEGVKAVVQATTYDMNNERLKEQVELEDGTTVTLATPISAMRSATAKFVNDIKAEEPIFDYNAIKHNASLPIQINVTNAGKDKLESVTITTDGTNSAVREFKNLDLMPNETTTLTIYRDLESEDKLISNFNYSINAKFVNNDTVEKSGSVNLQVPDSAIAAVDTVKEEHGVRTMQLKLYNQSDIELARMSGYKVRVGFFKDNACMTPFENEIRAIGENGASTTLADGTITFEDQTSLTLIDDDAMVYNFEYTLPEAGFANGDINLYTKVWIEDGDGKEVGEYYQSNNVGNATFTDPVARNNGEQFLITSEMSNGATGSTAKVSVKNLALKETEKNGNLVVSLLDAKGNVIETKQTAMTANDLIKLGKEDEQSFTFEFSDFGHAVQCSYNTVSADELDATLSSLKLDGVAIEFNKDKEEYEAEVSNMLSTVLSATTSNIGASIKVQNVKGDELATSENGTVAKNLALELSSTDGEVTDNVIKLVVTPKNTSAATRTYIVTLHNKAENKSTISLDLPSWTNKSGETEFMAKLRNFENTPEGYTVQVDDGDKSDELKWLGTTESKLTANIPDEEGVHKIKVSVRDDLGFNTSEEKEVMLDKTAPTLNEEDIEFVETDTPLNKGGVSLMGVPAPNDGITENQLKVYVKASDALSGVDKVTANAGGRVYEAKLNDDGRYELTVEYAFRGELEITATDRAGNSTTVGKAVNVDDEMPMGNILTGTATTTQTSATLYGTVTTKDAYLAECGIEYKKQGDKNWTTLTLTDASKKNDFSFTLDNLEANTEYIYRVYVRSMANAMFYGDTKSFKLADCACSVNEVEFTSPLKLNIAANESAKTMKLNAQAKVSTNGCDKHDGEGEITYKYEVVSGNAEIVNNALVQNTLKVTEEGIVRIKITATYSKNGEEVTSTVAYSDITVTRSNEPSVTSVSYKQPTSSAGGNVVISLKGDNLDEAKSIVVKVGKTEMSAVKVNGVYAATFEIPANEDTVNEETYDIEVYVNGVKQVLAGEVPQIIVPRADKGGNSITYFYAEGQIGDAKIGENTIAITMPYATDLNEVKAKLKEIVSLEVSANATYEMANAAVADGKLTAEYTVTAENGTSKTYTLTISLVATPAIDESSFDGIAESGLKTIEIKGKNLENAKHMAVVLYDKLGQEVSRADVTKADGKYSANITVPENADTENAKVYTFAYVIDGVETKTAKTVTVSRHSYGESKLMRFDVEGAKSVTLNEFTGKISVVMPYDYEAETIKASYKCSAGATAKLTVGETEVSEISSNGATTMTVTSEDGKSVTTYIIEVTRSEVPSVTGISYKQPTSSKGGKIEVALTGKNLDKAHEITVKAVGTDGEVSATATAADGNYTATLAIPENTDSTNAKTYDIEVYVNGIKQVLAGEVPKLTVPRADKSGNDITYFYAEGQIGDAVIGENTIAITMPYKTELDAVKSKLKEIVSMEVSENATYEMKNAKTADGKLTAEYIVTAENGDKKTYTLTISLVTAPTIDESSFDGIAESGLKTIEIKGENLENAQSMAIVLYDEFGQEVSRAKVANVEGKYSATISVPENADTENERTYTFAYVIDGVETKTEKTVKVSRHSYGESKLMRFDVEGAKSIVLDEFTGKIKVVMPYDYAEATIKSELAYSTGASAKFTVDGNEVSEIPSSGVTTLTITSEDSASVTTYEIEVVNEETPYVNLMSFNANPYNKESKIAIRVTGVNLENAREIKVTATAADGTVITETAKKSGMGEYTAMLTIPQSLYLNEDRVFELSAEVDGVAQEQIDNAQAQLVQPKNNNVIEGFVIEDMLGEAQISHNDNTDSGEIRVVMPYDADLTKLNPSITLRNGAKLNPEKVSDFSQPIKFNVTTVNHVDRSYTVTVTKKDAPIISKVEYTPFTSAKAGKTTVTMTGENLDNLRNAQVTAKLGETAITADAVVENGVLKAELEIPENKTTETAKWALSLTDKSVTIAIPDSAVAVQAIPAILEFNIPDQVSSTVINNKITVFMPRGVKLKELKPQIKLSEGTKIVEPTGELVDFSRIVTYKLQSGEDTAEYTVTVKNQGSTSGGGGGGGSFSGGGGGGTSTVIKPTATPQATATPEPTATPQASATPKPSKVPFTDVKEGDWYYDAVSKAYADGIMNGISDTEFGANAAVTRAMFVTILHRMEGTPEAAAKAKFTDVKDSEYYANAVAWANENGIVKGMSDTEFAPDVKITREQTAAILERYAEFKGMATDETADLNKFSDAVKVSDWAVGNLAWAVGKGLIAGKDGNVLDPKGEATRAELAVILQRFLEKN